MLVPRTNNVWKTIGQCGDTVKALWGKLPVAQTLTTDQWASGHRKGERGRCVQNTAVIKIWAKSWATTVASNYATHSFSNLNSHTNFSPSSTPDLANEQLHSSWIALGFFLTGFYLLFSISLRYYFLFHVHVVLPRSSLHIPTDKSLPHRWWFPTKN